MLWAVLAWRCVSAETCGGKHTSVQTEAGRGLLKGPTWGCTSAWQCWS